MDEYKEIRKVLDNSGIIRHCANCEHHTEMDGGVITCDFVPKSTIPHRVLIYGCPNWDMEIPF